MRSTTHMHCVSSSSGTPRMTGHDGHVVASLPAVGDTAVGPRESEPGAIPITKRADSSRSRVRSSIAMIPLLVLAGDAVKIVQVGEILLDLALDPCRIPAEHPGNRLGRQQRPLAGAGFGPDQTGPARHQVGERAYLLLTRRPLEVGQPNTIVMIEQRGRRALTHRSR